MPLPVAMILAVTGGTGFVGGHVLDLAVAQGHSVRALARRRQPPRPGVTWVAGDLAAPGALCDGADAVIHIAGTINAATYAVTVEQAGGSPSGKPTSAPIYTGKLIETVPATR